jgi:hypothetical protein
VIHDEEIGERRKSITHRAVFLADDGHHYAVEWDEPKSEAQEGIEPFGRQGDAIKAVRVELRKRTVVIDEWLPIAAVPSGTEEANEGLRCTAEFQLTQCVREYGHFGDHLNGAGFDWGQPTISERGNR